ncbi:MAG: hypothetical protein ACJ735_12105 [Actinomycetes bacterium]
MTEPTVEQLQTEIDEIDATLRRLRAERGSGVDDPGDRSDAATDLTSYEEEQALIENLEARRRALTAQLDRG